MAASANDMLQKVGVAGTLTSLSAPGHSISGTTITVGSTTNWPTDTGVTFAIRQVDSSGVLVAGTYTEWRGVVSGSTLTGMVLAYGTDQVYPAGSTTQVYIPVSAYAHNRLIDGLLVEHGQDGTHGAITAASVASAGAVSGTSVIGTSFTQGSTRLDTGWFPGSSTWAYASATTFTVSATEAAFMSVGTKIWITQTTSKYFYVTGVSGTTITVTAGSDYTVANAAITAPYYSNAETPFGFPGRFGFTTSWSNLTVGNATDTSTFSMHGKDVTLSIRLVLGNTSSVGTTPRLTLPVATAATGYNDDSILSIGVLTDTGSAYYKGHLQWVSTTTADLYTEGAGSTYVNTNTVSATIPFTWSGAAADRIALNIGSYKAA